MNKSLDECMMAGGVFTSHLSLKKKYKMVKEYTEMYYKPYLPKGEDVSEMWNYFKGYYDALNDVRKEIEKNG